MCIKDKKATQLGMNPSTASGRLVKDLLFAAITEKNYCYHCGKPMSRDDFTIEHKEPWLDSEDPAGLFFDLGNIAYSHHSCNIKAARKTRAGHGTYSMSRTGCGCDLCKDYMRQENARSYTPEKRRNRYLKTGV